MQRDLQITPRRLEYTREKEGELFTSLMTIANRKQEEMKDMIVETLGSMKEQLLEDAANLEFTGQRSSRLDQNRALGPGSCGSPASKRTPLHSQTSSLRPTEIRLHPKRSSPASSRSRT